MQNQNRIFKITSILLLVLLIISLSVNFYQWNSRLSEKKTYQKANDNLKIATVDVEKELKSVYEELNKYKGQNERLDSIVNQADLKIDQQRHKIKELIIREKNKEILNQKLTEEIEKIKIIRIECLEEVEKLLAENRSLKQNKILLDSTVENISKNLKTTIATASVLKIEYVKIKSFKKKNNGRYTETATAKRTNKIEICFNILENSIATPGEKNIYLKIIEPHGKTMGFKPAGSGFVNVNNQDTIQFTTSKMIDYYNEEQNVCMVWEEPKRIFTKGKYTIDIYIDNVLSKTNTYSLK